MVKQSQFVNTHSRNKTRAMLAVTANKRCNRNFIIIVHAQDKARDRKRQKEKNCQRLLSRDPARCWIKFFWQHAATSLPLSRFCATLRRRASVWSEISLWVFFNTSTQREEEEEEGEEVGRFSLSANWDYSHMLQCMGKASSTCTHAHTHRQ